MPSVYQTVFNGGIVAPSPSTYLPLTLSANVILGWPLESNITSPAAAEIIDVTATAPSLTIQLSDARQVGNGYSVLFNNVGGNTFTVLDNLGDALMAPAPGAAWLLYLADNSTQQGTWRAFQYGASVSTANAAALAGAGLKAISTTLNEQITINPQATNYTIGTGTFADRAACIEWTGGSGGTFTTQTAAMLGTGWFCFIKNSGTGVLTLTPGSGTVNGTTSMTFNPNDSAIIATDGTNFFSIGFGQSVASSFNFVTISLASAPATVTLTGAQLNRISYRFTGALTNNVTVVVPASIQQYWVDNETTGSFTLTISAGGAGSTYAVPQANRTILYCDGLNVVNAVTGGGVTFGAGTAAAPAITFSSDTTTGLYLVGSHVLGFAAGGVAAGSVNGSLQWSLPAATTGTTLTVSSLSGASALALAATTGAAAVLSIGWSEGIDTNTWNIFCQSNDPLVIGTGSGTLSFATAAANRIQINSAGNVSVLAPATGNAVTITGAATTVALTVISGNSATTSEQDVAIQRAGSTANALLEGPNLLLGDTTNSTYTGLQQSGGQSELWQFNSGSWAQVLKVATTRAVTINAPTTSTPALTITGAAGGGVLVLASGLSATATSSELQITRAGSTANGLSEGPNVYCLDIANTTGTVLQQSGGQSELWQFNSSWVQQWRVTTAGILQARDQGGTMQDVGWRGVPQNIQNGNYTLVVSDRGKSVWYEGTGGNTYTVPSGVFSAGDVVTIVAFNGTTSLSIAQGSGMTMFWGGNGSTTGNRTLNSVGDCTLLFQNGSACIAFGAGLT